MRSKIRRSFAKLQATGNDFVLVRADSPEDWPGLAQKLCDRRFGIGADGLLVDLPAQRGGDRQMRIFNADGSEAEMCGNGLRCFALYLSNGQPMNVETQAGLLRCEKVAEGVRVALPQPTQPELGAILGQAWWRVSLGNPHAVQFVPDVDQAPVLETGSAMQTAVEGGINAEFVQVVDPHHVRMRVFERGVGETPSCGTGAAAAALAAIQAGHGISPVTVSLPGGQLVVEWDGQTLYQTGPAQLVFEGELAD